MRFLVIALLLGTLLRATTPPALLEIAKKLHNTMATVINQSNTDLTRNNAAIDSLPAIQKLTEQFFNQVPLLQRFKPRNAQEKRFISALKQFEMLHLFALMNGYINVERHRPPFAQVISDYLKVLDFIYAPLLQAHQEGLDLNSYTQALSALQSDPADWDKMVQYFIDNQQISPKPMLPVQAFFKDFKIVELAYRLIRGEDQQDLFALLGESQDWEYADLYAAKKLGIGQDSDIDVIVGTDDYYDRYASFYAQYSTRLVEFLYESYYYTFDDPLSSPQLDIPTLQQHPQLCFKPQYLRQKFKQACLDILKGTYKT
ncbi:hypothetical protein HHE03_09150 [Helicobacter heilmannii]|uniref:hypothetical protein n=1 Tax=Helicobacter heilmannii TaxID=35817 RepID=UPI0006A02E92|nr:hypothetical protein [Helicobacter heilmannii]CRF49310.1 hypothetical protein HHE03_09150 [Helicobacter heilmannii]